MGRWLWPAHDAVVPTETTRSPPCPSPRDEASPARQSPSRALPPPCSWLDISVVNTALSDIASSLHTRAARPSVGRRRLHPAAGRHRPHGRRGRGSRRSPPRVRRRPRAVHRRFGSVRARRRNRPAHRLSCRPGPRRLDAVRHGPCADRPGRSTSARSSPRSCTPSARTRSPSSRRSSRRSAGGRRSPPTRASGLSATAPTTRSAPCSSGWRRAARWC